jgi:hypothetical protein
VLHSGEILGNYVFGLYTYDAYDEVIKAKFHAYRLLVDHRTTIPLIKWTTSRMEIQFSVWLESLRKDVKCTFGFLKVDGGS